MAEGSTIVKRLSIVRAARIGIRSVWQDLTTGQWYVSIRNRSYRSDVPVTEETARRYYDKLAAE